MTEIYWITRIGTINNIALAVVIISLAIFAVLMIGVLMTSCSCDEDDNAFILKTYNKIRKQLIASLIISTTLVVFVPNKSEMLAIFGIGGTIDYIKSNDKAKQLPDKVVDALTRYVDSIEKDKEKDSNK